MKLIPLTRGKVAAVDDEDYDELTRYNWIAVPSRRTWYAKRGIMVGPRQQRLLSMQTAITGHKPTDHRDGDGLNNQRCNLRPVSAAQNAYNRRKPAQGSNTYKGTTLHRLTGKWAASIKQHGVRRHLGLFTEETEAALAYDAAARELFGPYAALNFPLPGERSALTDEPVTA